MKDKKIKKISFGVQDSLGKNLPEGAENDWSGTGPYKANKPDSYQKLPVEKRTDEFKKVHNNKMLTPTRRGVSLLNYRYMKNAKRRDKALQSEIDLNGHLPDLDVSETAQINEIKAYKIGLFEHIRQEEKYAKKTSCNML